jgi:acylglycerol lipase
MHLVPTSSTTTVAARDGTDILVRRWPPTGSPWASALLVHGIAEHSGRYEHVGQWMAEAGLDVTGYDQRGFGGSGGRRAWIDRWSRNHDDLEDRLAAVRVEAQGRPVVVYGHSLGGLIVLGYAVSNPRRPQPDAYVLSAPALSAAVPAWKELVARLLGRLAPNLRIANAFDGGLLSRDPEVGRRYLADPLNEHATTAAFGSAALREQARVRKALDALAVPTLVIHGTADRLVPPAATEPLAPVPGVTRRTYPDLRHETHNEPEGRRVIDDVIDWLRTVVG